MANELKIETIGRDNWFGTPVHDALELWQHSDGDVVLMMKDQILNERLQMWITQDDAAKLRDFLTTLLKGTKHDPEQNIS